MSADRKSTGMRRATRFMTRIRTGNSVMGTHIVCITAAKQLNWAGSGKSGKVLHNPSGGDAMKSFRWFV